jgi:large subunit ribosomal protein L18
MKVSKLNQIKIRRRIRVRRKLIDTSNKPRLSVFRSNVHIYAQLIDDSQSKTLLSASSLELKNKKKMTKSDIAKAVGKSLAEKAIKAGIKEAAFDRGSYRYHGRVKALAEAVREGGLKI